MRPFFFAMMFENQFVSQFPCWLVATDEAGRGPLAGPVVSAAAAIEVKSQAQLALLMSQLRQVGVNDSKKLTASKREELRMRDWGEIQLSWCEFSAAEIDRLNILQASLLSMQQAAEELVSQNKKLPVVWLIDGNRRPKSVNPLWQVHTIVSGDAHSALIGLASIVAKVERDHIMQRLHQRYPQYGFGKHAGYPTAEHRAAIATHGPSEIHRKTFKGVREYLAR